MGSFTLCVLVASAATILAHPTGSQPGPSTTDNGPRIVSVLLGKNAIKSYLNSHPSVQYQNLGKPDPDFPHSKLGHPGQLMVFGVIRGKEPIDKFIADTKVPVRFPENLQNPWATGVSQHPSTSGTAPSQRRTPLTPEQQQELINSGLGKLPPPSPYAGAPPPPPRQQTYEEQLAEWNSGIRSTPPDMSLKPPVPGALQPPVPGALQPPVPGALQPPVPGALKPPVPGAAPSNPRNPTITQGQRPASNVETYEQQLAEWNSGLRSNPPDSWLSPYSAGALVIPRPNSPGSPGLVSPPSSPRNPPGGQPSRWMQQEASPHAPPKEGTYEEQLAAWNRGLRGTPPDPSLAPTGSQQMFDGKRLA